jgi:hypothetical protein
MAVKISSILVVFKELKEKAVALIVILVEGGRKTV